MNNQIMYTVNRILTEEQIKDILTTAIEGGIGYWAVLCNDTKEWAEAKKLAKEELGDTPCYCDVIYKMFELNYPVIFEDNECAEYDEDDCERWELTFEKFLNGCRLYEEKSGKSLSNIIDECEYDADDADCVMQYALFGELVFGCVIMEKRRTKKELKQLVEDYGVKCPVVPCLVISHYIAVGQKTWESKSIKEDIEKVVQKKYDEEQQQMEEAKSSKPGKTVKINLISADFNKIIIEEAYKLSQMDYELRCAIIKKYI